MKRNYKLLAKFILLSLMLLVVSGCNQSLVINDFNVDSEQYNKEGHFLPKRLVKFSVNVKNDQGRDLDYKWTANGGQILEKNKSQINYLTPNLPGDYTLFLTIKDQSGEQIQHEFSFNVKGDYPPQVSLDDLTTSSLKSGIKVTWSKYPKDDFYTYKILRSNNNFIDGQADVIATINNQSQNSYVDYNINPKQVYSYQVMVINNSGYLSISNEKMIETLPQRITKVDLQGQLSDIVIDETRSKLYLNNAQQNKLLILDAESQKVEKKVNWDFAVEKLFLGEQNNYLFALAKNKKTLLRLDLEDFSQQQFSFAKSIKDISLTAEKMYVAVSGEYNLIKFDIEEGKIIERLKVTHNNNVINASQIDILDEEYLFIDKVFGESLIYILDNLQQPISKFDIGIVKNSMFCEINGESCLYVANTHHPLQVYSGIKSGKASLKNKFDKISTPKDFAVDEEQRRIFAAVDKMIYIYSLDNNQLLNKIKLDHYINRLAWNQQQNKLYLLTSEINQSNYNLMIADLKQFSREDNNT
ncbi:fibronectin type III domain-containing protein [Halanaerobacter jeridensis]|uniref:Fibronectin type-III domain-containing protein n=1 Tax=Halanaerobacter jeridensis TaxID=706427 RepID=A0A939BNU0_9FIRM|nr:fibronectin type III domain-containing protein [Halanaerobacter jeridensis]MBM7555818.1 hypothetical protein [Halanaerobacter jeridensis]